MLNLFAYTGAATVACRCAAGASVCHVDAAKGMVAWAKENAAASGVAGPARPLDQSTTAPSSSSARFDAAGATTPIIMDPPSYGRGPGGEVWKLEESLPGFVQLVSGVLSDDPLFVIINSYTTGLSPSVLTYISESIFTKRFGGRSESLGAGPARHGDGAVPARRRRLPLGARGVRIEPCSQ